MKYIRFLDDLVKDMSAESNKKKHDSHENCDVGLKKERVELEQLPCEGYQKSCDLSLTDDANSENLPSSADLIFDSP